jgi:two-component system response regulator MprA
MPTTLARTARLPARWSDAPHAGRHGSPAPRVLLADPCRDTVESLGWLLRLWGFDVLTAETGPDALASALADRPDAVLMEIALPRLDGWQVASRLRGAAGRDARSWWR